MVCGMSILNMLSQEDLKGPRLSERFINDLLKSDIRIYYRTRELNDKLYLHFKGFRKIENLEEFTGLKVLYMEGNAIDRIEGLENCRQMRCLYLHENCIQEITGLDYMEDLDSLNLSDNLITSISGLHHNLKLSTLHLSRNRIGKNGVEDLVQLTQLPNLSVLDLSNNSIEDPRVLEEVFEKMSNLRVLYLHGNPVCKKIPNYRKTLTFRLKELRYLDDRPVFEEDRRFAEAFFRGGLEEERAERKRWQQEKEAERLRNHEAFREMINQARRERQERREVGLNESYDSEASTQPLTDRSADEQSGSEASTIPQQDVPFLTTSSTESEKEEIPYLTASSTESEHEEESAEISSSLLVSSSSTVSKHFRMKIEELSDSEPVSSSSVPTITLDSSSDSICLNIQEVTSSNTQPKDEFEDLPELEEVKVDNELDELD